MENLKTGIYFDMDGTFVDFYGVENWLQNLQEENARPYLFARPLVHMSTFAQYINRLQNKGYKIGIISWCSKNGTPQFNLDVQAAKLHWLAKHCPSIKWDEIHIIPYGTPKWEVATTKQAILFDDEVENRIDWERDSNFIAFNSDGMFSVLKMIMKGDF